MLIIIDEYEEPGERNITWDGRDSKGRKAPVGVYFYRLETDKYKKIRKMIVAR